jgi:hypothetical protein
MSHALDHDSQPISAETQPTSNGVGTIAPDPAPVRPDEVDRAVDWGRQRPRITVGAAVLLAIAASAATAVGVRRRQRQKLGRLAWISARAGAIGAATADAPLAARAGGAGGLGGVLLLVALLAARARQAHAQSQLELLSERLAALEAVSSSGRPRPRDVAIGAVVGCALATILARRGGGQQPAN